MIGREIDLQERNKFFDLFFTLPNELQIQILCGLQFDELLALRLSNTSFFNLIHQNESPLVRHLIKNDAPRLLLDLWPPPQIPQAASFAYFLGLTHREIVVRDLATHIADFIMIKICRRTTKSQQEGFHPRYQRIRSRCEPLILTLYHFFESYRNVLMKPVINETSGSRKSGPLYSPSLDQLASPREIEKKIIDRYDTKQLLQVHQIYKLLLAAFVRKLRPPSYAGRLERSLRGWSKTPASQDDIVKVLLLGGIREVKQIIEIKTYSARRKALDDFIEGLTLPKEDDLTRPNGVVSEPPIALSSNPALVANSVERFVTAFLDEEGLNHISRSFPELREIWSHTVESLLLEKNIINSVYEIPTMREFIESLMREEHNETSLRDGEFDDSSGNESDSIDLDGGHEI